MTRCAGCKKTISASYINALGKAWHPQCFCCAGCGKPVQEDFTVIGGKPFHQGCFLCAGCKRPIGKQPYLMKHGKKFWHKSCFLSKHGKVCKGCGEIIAEATFQALDAYWHQECFVCGDCGTSIGAKKFPAKDGKPYHEACFHRRFSPKCSVCLQPMKKEFLQDAWGNRFCRIHRKKLPRCFSCQRIICDAITQGGKAYEDKRTVCNICFASAVNDQQQAVALVSQMRGQMQHLGFPFKDEHIPFRLVDQKELKKYAKRWKKDRPTLGMARANRSVDSKGNIVERQFEEIIILYGLPKEHFLSVAIHELCHAWLFFRCFDNLPTKVEEGICTLSEYLYLKTLDTKEAKVRLQIIMNNEDPIYGKGFRAARKAMDAQSLQGMLRQVYRKKKFSSGLLSWLT